MDLQRDGSLAARWNAGLGRFDDVSAVLAEERCGNLRRASDHPRVRHGAVDLGAVVEQPGAQVVAGGADDFEAGKRKDGWSRGNAQSQPHGGHDDCNEKHECHCSSQLYTADSFTLESVQGPAGEYTLTVDGVPVHSGQLVAASFSDAIVVRNEGAGSGTDFDVSFNHLRTVRCL